MAGLHDCPRCGYGFPDRPSKEAHLEACDGDMNGQNTGRKFLTNPDGDVVGMTTPTNGVRLESLPEYGMADAHVWTEMRDPEGELWYECDDDEDPYTLSAEEFGPTEPEEA